MAQQTTMKVGVMMESSVLVERDRLLEISRRKVEMLTGIIEHLDDIVENELFVEEIEEAYRDLCQQEMSLVQEREVTVSCPACGVECAKIYSYCMVCGKKLHPETVGDDIDM